MAHDKLADLLRTQKSLTEWLEDIKHKDADIIRREDNDKRERLRELHNIIAVPFDEPTQFEAQDLADKTPGLSKYLKEHGGELCALRLMPKVDGLPKLRMRGKTVAGAYEWFKEQDIDPSQYRADFIPHVENTSWATIFVVNKHGIQGEITRGGHHQLTQGFHEGIKPLVFRYDFKTWAVESDDEQALTYLKRLADYLHVPNKQKQTQLEQKLNSTFSHDYLEGYFESTDSKEFGTWFIDYSASLGKMYGDMVVRTKNTRGGLVKGQTGSPGKAEGPVKIVDPKDIDADFPTGGVLVCAVTTPDYVPLMQKAVAIVTDQGGILAHAAIVARELHKPCIVGTGNATKILKDGQGVSVDADNGIVTA
jgi:phosphohistidine swiveling domain-containing protein